MKAHRIEAAAMHVDLANEIAAGRDADGNVKKIIVRTRVGDGKPKAWFEVTVDGTTWGFATIEEAVEHYNDY